MLLHTPMYITCYYILLHLLLSFTHNYLAFTCYILFRCRGPPKLVCRASGSASPTSCSPNRPITPNWQGMCCNTRRARRVQRCNGPMACQVPSSSISRSQGSEGFWAWWCERVPEVSKESRCMWIWSGELRNLVRGSSAAGQPIGCCWRTCGKVCSGRACLGQRRLFWRQEHELAQSILLVEPGPLHILRCKYHVIVCNACNAK